MNVLPPADDRTDIDKFLPFLAGCLVILVSVCITTFLLFKSSVVFIQPDEVGVVISMYEPAGYRKEVLNSGLHLIRPGESVKIYKISRQTYRMSSTVASGDDSIRAKSSDGQEILVEAIVIYTIDPEKVLQLHINWQDRYEANVVRPLSRGIIRDILSEYTMDQIRENPEEIEEKLFNKLKEKLSENYLILVDIIVQNIELNNK